MGMNKARRERRARNKGRARSARKALQDRLEREARSHTLYPLGAGVYLFGPASAPPPRLYTAGGCGHKVLNPTSDVCPICKTKSDSPAK